MKILSAENTKDTVLVDFYSPPYMTEEQFKKFLDFFDETRLPHKIIDKEEKMRQMGGGDSAYHKWKDDEKLLLFRTEISNAEIAHKTEHTAFSVQLKRGEVLSEYFNWCKKKGLDPNDAISRKKFLEGG